ncbi:hypothetical protein [Paenibacillus xylanexedens]|uniref:hypothetical protein n=1 Tax=Paenibacillus xylanexedens TaxID=528191 RepID=UPI0011A81B1F|nr:hypothetical protein [Paenibacillus xylanexedens]
MNYINQLVANPIVSLLLAISTIAGFVLSIIFYLKSKRVRKLIYSIESKNLINNENHVIDNVRILYNEKDVNNLTISKISIWNAGKETVNKEDVVIIDPIKLRLSDDCALLDAKIIRRNEPANNVSIEVSGNVVNLNFDYFDFNDFVIIQVIHTGLEETEIKGVGKIKGQGPFRRFKFNKTYLFLMHIISFLFSGSTFNIQAFIDFRLNQQTDFDVYRVHKKSGARVLMRKHRRWK